MKQMMIWVGLILKRLARRRGFLILLLILPLTGVFISYWESNHTRGVEIGLVAGSDAMALKTVQDLLTEDTMFTFREYPDAGSLEQAVQTRVLEAGFRFADDLTRRVAAGESRDLVQLYRSPASVTQGMASEVVFSQLLHNASPELIASVVRDSGLFPGETEAVTRRILERYETYRAQGGTYQFSYEYLSGTPAPASGIPLFPVQGLTSLFLLITAWVQVLDHYRDRAAGIYGAFVGKRKQPAVVLAVYVPVLVMALAGFLLFLSRMSPGRALLELVWLMVYGLAVSLFLLGIRRFFPNPIAFAALMPAVLLGSLVASPVILDMSALVPNLAVVEKLFFPSYYLALSAGKAWGGIGLLAMGAFGALLLALDPGIPAKSGQ